MTTQAERQRDVVARIEAGEQADFYAPLLALTLVNLFPDRSTEAIADAVLSAYKQLEAGDGHV